MQLLWSLLVSNGFKGLLSGSCSVLTWCDSASVLSINCMLMQEEGFSPARAGPAYAPVLTNALPARQLSHLSLSNPNNRAQAFGDLFGPPSGSLPNVTIPDCPQLPDWNHQRPYLTGQFLLEGLELDEAISERQQALESFSSDVQELVGNI